MLRGPVAAISFNEYEAHQCDNLPLPVLLEILCHEQLQSYDKNLSNCISSYMRANEGHLKVEEYGKVSMVPYIADRGLGLG